MDDVEIIRYEIPLDDYEKCMTQLISALLDIDRRLFPLESGTQSDFCSDKESEHI